MSAEERLVEQGVEALKQAERTPIGLPSDGPPLQSYSDVAAAVLSGFDPNDLGNYLREREGEEGAARAIGLVHEGWLHGDGYNITAFRPLRDGEPSDRFRKWRSVFSFTCHCGDPSCGDEEG